MKGGEPTHRQSKDMGGVNVQCVEHGQDVVAGEILAIHLPILRNVRWRKAAGVKGDASVPPREVANLRFPASEIAGELMDKDDRRALTGFFVKKVYAVFRGHLRH